MGRTAADVMGARGDDVVVASPEETVGDVVERLAARGIGAVVVVDAERRVVGVLSERDVVRRLSAVGQSFAEEPVADVMTTTVTTCVETATTDELMSTMTDGRFRHVPVVAGDVLVGIVSVGDVVKARIDELRGERDQLQEYVQGGY